MSAPFIFILIRMADLFKLRKSEATLLSLLMVSFALIFPTVLRREKVLYWILGVCGLLLFTVGLMLMRNGSKSAPENDHTVKEPIDHDNVSEQSSTSEQESILEEPIEEGHGDKPEFKLSEVMEGESQLFEDLEYNELELPIEEPSTEELPAEAPPTEEFPIEAPSMEELLIETPLAEELLTEVDQGEMLHTEIPIEKAIIEDQEEPNDVHEIDKVINVHTKGFCLEDLIENGFRAKEQGRFHLAAEWFILALEQKPSYDVAYYLIVDTCEHWKNGSSIHEALDKVEPYINEYIQNAPPEWRTQLMEWLTSEKLPIPRELRGRID